MEQDAQDSVKPDAGGHPAAEESPGGEIPEPEAGPPPRGGPLSIFVAVWNAKTYGELAQVLGLRALARRVPLSAIKRRLHVHGEPGVKDLFSEATLASVKTKVGARGRGLLRHLSIANLKARLAAKPDLEKGFYVIAVLPPILYVLASHYTRRYEGAGTAYAGIAMIVPFFLSYVMIIAGGSLIFFTRRRREPILGLIIATLVAASFLIWFVFKLIVLVFARHIAIDLGFI